MRKYDRLLQDIEKLLVFLNEFLPFANSHMVDYFTESLFLIKVPPEIIEEINNFGPNKAIQVLLDINSNVCMPNLKKFIKRSKSFILYNMHSTCLSREAFFTKFDKQHSSNLKFEGFMKHKKSHEVEILSAVASSLQTTGDITHFVDIGDGKGYLSSLLALHNRIPVLGVDSSSTKTEGSIERLQKLEKRWNGFIKSPIKTQNKDDSKKLYKQITQYVTEDTDFDRLISDNFSKNNSKIGLLGLHTCGNLGAVSIQIFSKNYNILTLCNVSCCYHLLGERHERGADGSHFPLSRLLNERKFRLGRNARMLAAQSLDRILYKKEPPNKSNFYRAVLQIFLQNYGCDLSNLQLGHVKKKYSNFVEYAKQALKSVQNISNVCNEELETIYKLYESEESKFYVFYLLRCYLAPAIESIILMDRLVYLYENGHECAYLVHLFDSILSPRCYGLIALKNTNSVNKQ